MLFGKVYKKAVPKVFLLTLTVVWLLFPGRVTAGPPATAEPMPEVLFVETWSTDWPVWVSAKQAWTGTELNPEYFSPSRLRSVHELVFERQRGEDGCVVQTEITASGGVPGVYGDLTQKLASTDAVLVVEVTGTSGGLMGSQAGSLIRVRPVRALKGSYRSWPHFLFLPQGELEIAGVCIRREDRRFIDLPDTGDQLVLLLPPHWEHSKEFLVLPEDSILALQSHGRLGLPETYRVSQPGGSVQNLETLEDLLGAGSETKP